MAASSAQEALEALPQIKNKGEDVALFLSDQRMPSMNGVEFLKQAKRFVSFGQAGAPNRLF